MASSLTALNKKELSELGENELMDCRLVCKGNALRKLFLNILYIPFVPIIEKVWNPCQFELVNLLF